MKETRPLDFGGTDDLDLQPSSFGINGLNVKCLSPIPYPPVISWV